MTTSPLHQSTLPALAALVDLQVQRLTDQLRAKFSAVASHHTRDTAATLYRRAAHYEATQPGFAADLRAAAESMDQSSVQPQG